jgi:hypothetical protein
MRIRKTIEDGNITDFIKRYKRLLSPESEINYIRGRYDRRK